MQTRSLDDVDRDIGEVIARLTTVNLDLARAPFWRLLTRWGRDRLDAMKQLRIARDALYRERRLMVVSK